MANNDAVIKSHLVKSMGYWRENGICGTVPREIFFPPTTAKKYLDAAKAVCMNCVVRESCLKWALDSQEGGTGRVP